jgi:hypothetical protein
VAWRGIDPAEPARDGPDLAKVRAPGFAPILFAFLTNEGPIWGLAFPERRTIKRSPLAKVEIPSLRSDDHARRVPTVMYTAPCFRSR